MKLYYSPGACSLSPHIVASEAGIAVTLAKVDLKTHKTADGGDYYQVNPKGYVPALVLDDGRMLTEGPAIVQYLADLKPDMGLIPRSGFERYKVIEWLTFINGEIHKAFSVLFGKDETAKIAAREKLGQRFAYVGQALGENLYLTGDGFTLADAYLFVMLRWAGKLHVAVPDNLARLRDRIAARPAVHKALQEEGSA